MQVQTEDNKAIVAKAIAAVGEIATLPEVTVKIIEVVEDPKGTARDLHNVIKQDPALSAKVLKVVNSAFYGLPGQVASVDRAIVLLGLSAVKNISIAASISRMFKSGNQLEYFDAKEMWVHSLAVSVCAKNICIAAGDVAGHDEVFLAGLIHDLGILIERQAFPEQLNEIARRASTNSENWLDLERELIGPTHQELGRCVDDQVEIPEASARGGWVSPQPRRAFRRTEANRHDRTYRRHPLLSGTARIPLDGRQRGIHARAPRLRWCHHRTARRDSRWSSRSARRCSDRSANVGRSYFPVR